jgi:hypothetical protein
MGAWRTADFNLRIYVHAHWTHQNRDQGALIECLIWMSLEPLKLANTGARESHRLLVFTTYLILGAKLLAKYLPTTKVTTEILNSRLSWTHQQEPRLFLVIGIMLCLIALQRPVVHMADVTKYENSVIQ